MKKYYSWTAGLIFVFFASATVFSQDEHRYSELQVFARVLNIIENNYVDQIDIKKLVTGAIKGMLRELDPHSSFLSTEVFRDFENETSGEFGGLGIEISIQNGQLTIISPIEDTPAWNAGIKAQDKVLFINNQSTKGFNLVDASKLLKGRRGEKVDLKILRSENGKESTLDFSIIRASVKIKSVKAKQLDNGYLYIKITSFIENTSDLLEKALHSVTHNNSTPLQGIVLDLRKNPGGLLDQAIKVSDLFLPEKKIIVSTMGRDPASKEVTLTTSRSKYLDIPLIILVDAGSASASEIVAGALQDHKRALLMGTKTFGKGSVQSIIKLGDGSALKLTIARYYTPSGRSIQAEGINPDLIFDETSFIATQKSSSPAETFTVREKDIKNHLKASPTENTTAEQNLSDTETGNKPSPENDPMVIQALNYLKVIKHQKPE